MYISVHILDHVITFGVNRVGDEEVEEEAEPDAEEVDLTEADEHRLAEPSDDRPIVGFRPLR